MKTPYWTILADCQLGAIHWQNPVREEDYYHAFQNQCRLAAEDPNCLGILGLGDLRERASLQAKNLGGLNRGLQILAQKNKPLLALMGNHDYTVPNWIEEMCYPSLKDLTNPHVQKEYGFDPNTTLALHYTPKSQLLETIQQRNPEDLSLIFLHQSLKELTTNLKQSYDLSLTDLRNLGVGNKKPCLVFLGDLHNYGDTTLDTITAAYPGSLEMTDINEGTLGLKSQRIASQPHDYRKFVVHFFPESQTWHPLAVQPRPWLRLKARTEREARANLCLAKSHLAQWEKPGCALLTCPKTHLETYRKELAGLPALECRIEEYQKDLEEKPLEETPHTALSWKTNKAALEELGEKELDADALLLLQSLLRHDGSTHNPKNDVLSAWEEWSPMTTPQTTEPTPPPNPQNHSPIPAQNNSHP
jgi:DNA repair exonuclease SbcCD nuclease subunit